MIETEVLRRPHLVLANIGREQIASPLVASRDRLDDGVGLGRFRMIFERGFQHAVALLDSIQATPLVVIALLDQIQAAALQRFSGIAHHRHIGADVLADLGRIDVDVNDFGVGRESGDLAGRAVVEARADVHQQIASSSAR